MTPPRPVLLTWRALAAADRVRTEFDRRIADLETLSAAVRAECHRLDGDGWRGAAFDSMLASVEAAHHHNRMLCEQAERLRDAGVRALSDLHYTALALLDYVADAEADGCAVADDWTVTVESATTGGWAEVIAMAVAAVEGAERRGQQAIMAVACEMRHLATVFGTDPALDGPPPPQARAQGTARSEAERPMTDATSPAAVAGSAVLAAESVTAHPVPPPQARIAGIFATDVVPTSPASGTKISTPAASFVSSQMSDPSGGITAEQLVAIMPDLPMDQAQQYLPALNAAMAEGGITTPRRQAAFLAQLAHESCQFRYFEELGDDDYFQQYDPGQPNAAAGNTEPGDGPRYHGRGPIQLTGRGNYRAAGQALGLDLEGDPELAARPDIGFRIAQWYWTSRDINALADAGDFAAVTQAVNGGYNGRQEREAYYQRALGVLG